MPEDDQLLQQLSQGSITAFKCLYQRYQPVLHRYLQPFRMVQDADEIVQDIFLKLWLKRKSLTSIRRFDQYLFRMARNRLLDLHKSNRARLQRETESHPTSEAATAFNFNKLEHKEFYEFALRAIAQLPERQRIIYELNVFQDHSLDEIAEQLGLSKSVVIKQLYLANKFVRGEVKKFGQLFYSMLSILP
ncbi:sigma-70 family RNA polymerase sigma factor [Pseudoflavitalea sp. G-6-1-2]|uniref:RNA polymerase sigma factor n=1 Tax=Pseudoflavitalea sp. G-6-1-2 TaxID=2728841 RepID=UPI00146B8963|nr:sigma-70 family RNA polymerase sigma factor [Pseudoflavitalea sp. G-6-1-2]NML23892.1 sigma-70 family RNA polymerase sigma factor [Pseudoflavitalea sp. G-6-1-2]